MSLVQKVTTDEQILATREVMRQLRPKLSPDDYLTTVKRMQQTDGYRLAAAYDEGVVRAIAGYRYMEMLFSGRILYVDDLSTDEQQRSKGYGKLLLDWLKAEAKAHSCEQLHLDSGVQRERAPSFLLSRGIDHLLLSLPDAALTQSLVDAPARPT
jgi:GNAT superfamily N-acetyltransferase